MTKTKKGESEVVVSVRLRLHQGVYRALVDEAHHAEATLAEVVAEKLERHTAPLPHRKIKRICLNVGRFEEGLKNIIAAQFRQ